MDDGNNVDEPAGWTTPQLRISGPKNPWWVAGRSLRPAIFFTSLWLLIFAIRLIATLVDGRIYWWGWASLILSGIAIVGYVPSILYFARNKKTR